MGRGGARARRLIVVSNRGPVTFGRDAGGDRVARRGGGGLVTALRGLVRRHAVTWVASALGDEDRAVAAERGGEAVEEKARGRLHVPPAPARPRAACVRPLLQHRRKPAAVVRPSLPVAAGPGSEFRPRVVGGLERGLCRRQRAVRGGRQRGARGRAGRSRPVPRLPPLPRAGTGAASRARGGALPLRARAVAGFRLLARASRADPRVLFTRGCSQTTSSASTPSAGVGASCARARTSPARVRASPTAS